MDYIFIPNSLFSLKKAGGGPFYVDIDTQENLWFWTTRDWQFEHLWSCETSSPTFKNMADQKLCAWCPRGPYQKDQIQKGQLDFGSSAIGDIWHNSLQQCPQHNWFTWIGL